MYEEIERLRRGVELLDKLRVLFYSMEDGGERDRAYAYLSDRFPELTDMPGWENIEDEVRESE